MISVCFASTKLFLTMAILVVAGQGRINWCNETTLPLLSIAASRGPVCVTLQPHRACWNLWFWQQNGRHATIEEVLSLIWTLQPTLQQPKALMKLCTPNRLYHECYMIVVFDFNNVITCNHHWYDAPTGVPTTSLTAPSSSHENIEFDERQHWQRRSATWNDNIDAKGRLHITMTTI